MSQIRPVGVVEIYPQVGIGESGPTSWRSGSDSQTFCVLYIVALDLQRMN